MARDLTKLQKIEQSLNKTYRKRIWSNFIKAIKRYELIEAGDKIAVCISGGKDSMLLAKLVDLLQKRSDVPFEVKYMAMDPGYSQKNRQKIIDNAALLNIDLEIFDANIFDVVDTVTQSPCYLCARMRRGFLYDHAKALGCNKIALGHHFSDVIETTLMSILYSAQIQGMLPKLHSSNFQGMELIRPLYLIHEDAIIAWRDYNNLEFLQCACHFTEENQLVTDSVSNSKRLETKELIRTLKKTNPMVEQNIFNSIHNVNVDTMVEYKLGSEKHSFLEKFSAK